MSTYYVPDRPGGAAGTQLTNRETASQAGTCRGPDPPRRRGPGGEGAMLALNLREAGAGARFP